MTLLRIGIKPKNIKINTQIYLLNHTIGHFCLLREVLAFFVAFRPLLFNNSRERLEGKI